MCIYINPYFQQLYSLSAPSKYLTWYCNIVSAARTRAATRKSAKRLFGYAELHHVIPKSFKLGGVKDPLNQVFLTAREHFMCHWLLTKIVSGKYKGKMIHAFWMMCSIENVQQQRHKPTSRTYEYAKQQLSILTTGRTPWNKGKHGYLTEEQHLALSAANRAKGPQSHKTIAKRVAKTTGKRRTDEQKDRISAALMGHRVSDETRTNQSISAKNRTRQSRYKGDPASLLPSASSLHWLIVSPAGEQIEVFGLAKWCREAELSYCMMHRAAQSGTKYKGYSATRC